MSNRKIMIDLPLPAIWLLCLKNGRCYSTITSLCSLADDRQAGCQKPVIFTLLCPGVKACLTDTGSGS
jgi:hypothetical protein